MKKILVFCGVILILNSSAAQRFVMKFGPDVGINRSRKFNKIIDEYNDKAGGEDVLKRMSTFYGYTIEFGSSAGEGDEAIDVTFGWTSHRMPLMLSTREVNGKRMAIQPHYLGWNFAMLTLRKGSTWMNLNLAEVGRFTMKYNIKGEKPWGGNIVEPIAIGSYTLGAGFGVSLGPVEVGIKARTTIVGAFDEGLGTEMGLDPFVKRTYAYSELGLHAHVRLWGK